MLKMRIVTAIILISAVLLGIFYANKLLQALILLTICLLTGYEWLRLIGAKTIHKIVFYNVLIVCCAVFYYMPFTMQTALWISLVGWVMAFFTILLYQKGRVIWSSNLWVNTLIGLWLIIPLWVGLYASLLANAHLLLFLLILVWTADACAYFAGRQWGRHLLLNRVSPGKTWEGVYGAIIGTSIIAYISMVFLLPQTNSMRLLILAVCIIPVAIIGDLFESMVKRIYGVKDSGQLLPGHGGVLDRLDSLTAAAPIFSWGYFLFVAHEM